MKKILIVAAVVLIFGSRSERSRHDAAPLRVIVFADDGIRSHHQGE